MFHACVQKFNMTDTVEIFLELDKPLRGGGCEDTGGELMAIYGDMPHLQQVVP